LPFGLGEPEWASFLRGLVRSDYHLLLGAGASMDSTDRLGRPLPSADALVRALVSDFAIPTVADGLTLGRAFDAAKGRRTEAGATLEAYLSERFLGCDPAEWYEGVTTSRWAALWSLNIDDVLQQAYIRSGAATEQTLTSHTWLDHFARPDPRRNQVQVVHLHGSATRLGAEGLDGIVFSILEYLRAVQHEHAWHHIFSDEFETQPFLVVGARLADEVDLAGILRRGNHAEQLTGQPSLVVLRDIDELQREEFASWGLRPVEATAKDFFDRVRVDLRTFESEFAAGTPGRPDRLEPEAFRFLRQFTRLRVDPHADVSIGHDLYAGHDPEWPDIVANRDAQFGVIRPVTRFVQARLEGAVAQTVTTILGPAFSGKSVALLRVARELLRGPHDVYVFEGDERIDVDAVLWWLAHSDKVVLLFDGLADHCAELGVLSRRCKLADVRLVALGTERESRATPVFSQLSSEVMPPDGVFKLGRLSDHDIHELVGKLTDARRLGRISGESRRTQEDYFRRDSGRELVEGMARLESGSGFIERLTRQYTGIEDSAHKAAYGIACIAYAFGHAIPISVLCSATGLSTERFIEAVALDKPLGEVLQLQGTKTRPRHRRLASLVVESVLNVDDRYQLSQVLAKNLAPYVTRETILQRTLPYRLARQLMNARVLIDWLDPRSIERWYDGLRTEYDWNARYWEQRAIASQRLNAFDRAESYAAHAVEVHRDGFTLTTLGSILLRKAHAWAEPGTEGSWELYRRGNEALHQAAERGEGRLELPYQAFFQNTLELVTAIGVPNPEVTAEWGRWYADAQSVPLFSHAEFARELAAYQERWLRFAIP
jgi:hypothetical protein